MHVKNLILGGGPAGLSAAYRLNDDYLLLEKENDIGGLCRSVEENGFLFDHAGHILFTNDTYVRDVLYPLLLGDNIHWQDREAWIYSKNVYTRYPFQAATFGLPVEVVKECILGAVEALYACESGVPRNFEEFILRNWGRGIAKHFMLPYNKKLWTIPLSQMSQSWLGGRVPTPELADIIDGALRPQPKPMGPNARFGYPIHGGFNALVNGWKNHIDQDSIKCGTSIQLIDAIKHRVFLNNGSELGYDNLIVTAPLPKVVNLLMKRPASVAAASRSLRWISVRCVNFGIERPDVTDKHWIYYPEEPVFHRLFIQSNASKHCAPPGCSGVTAEISYSGSKPLPAVGAALIARVIDDARTVGIVRDRDRVLVANEVDLPFAYVVPELGTDRSVAVIRDWLANHDIYLAGRFAEWAYYNSDHAMLAGKRVAEIIRTKRRNPDLRSTTSESSWASADDLTQFTAKPGEP